MAGERRGCLAALFGSFSASDTARKPSPAETAAPRYSRTDRFLSPAEASFLAALRTAVGNEYEIFPKVRLADLLSVRPGPGWQAAFNRVQSKHVDFLLCDRSTFRPVLALELDDSSHQRADRRARDTFVEDTFEVIGLPALRRPVTRTYDAGELARLIKVSIAGRPDP